MKKLLSSVFVFVMIFCLASCSLPVKTPGSKGKRDNSLNSQFTAEMTVCLEKLVAEGTVSRFGDGMWEAEFQSPGTLSGVKLSFADGNVTASYKGLSFSVPRSAIPVKAMLVNLMDAVDSAARESQLTGSEKDGIFEITGELESGGYTLCVDESGNICSFEMPNNLLKMTFTGVSASAAPKAETTETTEPATEEAAAEVTGEVTQAG
ncbi:MAG: hypothetical protein J6K77_02290 [Ruminococcus sp.]|nr:hypothetical protein [Ruminococcus sp.]